MTHGSAFFAGFLLPCFASRHQTKIKHIQEADYTFSTVGDPESHTDANHGSGEAPASPEDRDRGPSEVASNKEEDLQD